MKTLSVCLLLCVVTTLTRAAAVPEAAAENDEVVESHLIESSAYCCDGWFEFNGRCFLYVSREMTWATAEKNCQVLGGNLASVHSVTEYHELQKLILAASNEYKTTWIGGSDAQEENIFLWSDGRPFHYTNWCPGEPNNGRDKIQHCIQMNYGETKCWDDLQCHIHLPSVCAKRIW